MGKEGRGGEEEEKEKSEEKRKKKKCSLLSTQWEETELGKYTYLTLLFFTVKTITASLY